MTMPTLHHPIVFVHGLLGFDYLRLGRWNLACYWSKLPETIRAAGNRVHVAKVPPIGSVAERAGQLKAFLDEHCPGEPVHLIAHSMGGLDSRYMISRLDMASRVLSLTTIATPHRGTPFADWGLRRIVPIVGPFLDALGISRQAIHDLTTASCRRFNDEVPDVPGVHYFSVAGDFTASWRTPAWQLSWRIIQQEEGANDGLVPISSATYGETCNIWAGDHASLANFPDLFAHATGRWQDRTADYAALLSRLASIGT